MKKIRYVLIPFLNYVALIYRGVASQSDLKALLQKRTPSLWYDEAKIGIKLSWSIFSVPAIRSHEFGKLWELGEPQIVNYIRQYYPRHFTYQKFAAQMTAEEYKPEEIVRILQNSGAKYVIFTAKYNDGFSLWPSKYNRPMTSADLGAKRDILGEFENAIRINNTLKFGVYYALGDWFQSNTKESERTKNKNINEDIKDTVFSDLKDLITNYRPDILWFPFDECNTTDSYFNPNKFFTWLLHKSPVKDKIIFNNGWSFARIRAAGDFSTLFKFSENPIQATDKKSEIVLTLNRKGQGHLRDSTLEDFLTPKEIISFICKAVSFGLNVLIDIGMTSDGRISAIHEEQLEELRKWLKVNGEAIYGAQPWLHSNDTVDENIWYTTKAKNGTKIKIYAIILQWPDDNLLQLKTTKIPDPAKINMLGFQGNLQWTREKNRSISIRLPIVTPDRIFSKWAWVLCITTKKLERVPVTTSLR